MECRCDGLTTLWGAEAEQYAAEHLTLRWSAGAMRGYVCPTSGQTWLADEADGVARCRQVSEASWEAARVGE